MGINPQSGGWKFLDLGAPGINLRRYIKGETEGTSFFFVIGC